MPISCNQYEVDSINEYGELENVGCYTDFPLAKESMNNLGSDAVVHYSKSYSPSKIIAMKRGGIGNSYARRVGAAILSVSGYQNCSSTHSRN